MRLICLVLGLVLTHSAAAQSAPDDPMAVVTQLFEAMRASDTTAIAGTLHADARLLTAVVKPDGVPGLVTTPIPAFLTSVAGAPAGSLDERLYDVETRTDGTLASVWTPYRFYFNGNFSHCGVNHFTLAKVGHDWKILQIIDTRRREDCTME